MHNVLITWQWEIVAHGQFEVIPTLQNANCCLLFPPIDIHSCTVNTFMVTISVFDNFSYIDFHDGMIFVFWKLPFDFPRFYFPSILDCPTNSPGNSPHGPSESFKNV